MKGRVKGTSSSRTLMMRGLVLQMVAFSTLKFIYDGAVSDGGIWPIIVYVLFLVVCIVKYIPLTSFLVHHFLMIITSFMGHGLPQYDILFAIVKAPIFFAARPVYKRFLRFFIFVNILLLIFVYAMSEFFYPNRRIRTKNSFLLYSWINLEVFFIFLAYVLSKKSLTKEVSGMKNRMKESNAEKSRFIKLFSHTTSNTFSGITPVLQRIRDMRDGSKSSVYDVKQYLDLAVINAEHTVRHVLNFLSYQEIERGANINVLRLIINIDEVSQSIIQKCQLDVMMLSNISLQGNPSQSKCLCIGDEVLIARVVQNLVWAMIPRSEVRNLYLTSSYDPNLEIFTIKCCEFGLNVPKECDLSKYSEKLVVTDCTVENDIQLIVAIRIVEKVLHGRIRIREEKGSDKRKSSFCFVLDIPLPFVPGPPRPDDSRRLSFPKIKDDDEEEEEDEGEDDEEEEEEEEQEGEGEGKRPKKLKRMRKGKGLPAKGLKILVVDDFETCRTAIRRIIEFFTIRNNIKHEVVECVSGFAAYQCVKSGYNDFDLILTDYNMHKWNGDIFSRKIREENLLIYEWCKTYLISGCTFNDRDRFLKENYFEEMISKPIYPRILGNILNRTLKLREAFKKAEKGLSPFREVIEDDVDEVEEEEEEKQRNNQQQQEEDEKEPKKREEDAIRETIINEDEKQVKMDENRFYEAYRRFKAKGKLALIYVIGVFVAIMVLANARNNDELCKRCVRDYLIFNVFYQPIYILSEYAFELFQFHDFTVLSLGIIRRAVAVFIYPHVRIMLNLNLVQTAFFFEKSYGMKAVIGILLFLVSITLNYVVEYVYPVEASGLYLFVAATDVFMLLGMFKFTSQMSKIYDQCEAENLKSYGVLVEQEDALEEMIKLSIQAVRKPSGLMEYFAKRFYELNKVSFSEEVDQQFRIFFRNLTFFKKDMMNLSVIGYDQTRRVIREDDIELSDDILKQFASKNQKKEHQHQKNQKQEEENTTVIQNIFLEPSSSKIHGSDKFYFVSMKSLLEDVEKELVYVVGPEMMNKKVFFRIEGEKEYLDDKMFMNVDPISLYIILTNLLQNSIQDSKSNTIEINARFVKQGGYRYMSSMYEDEKVVVFEFSVSDGGKGMSPEDVKFHQNRLNYERRRGDPDYNIITKRSVKEGEELGNPRLGVGYLCCKKLMDREDYFIDFGHMHIQSAGVGEGFKAVFECHMLSRSVKELISDEEHPRFHLKGKKKPRSQMRVLLYFEEDFISGMVVLDMLKKMGFSEDKMVLMAGFTNQEELELFLRENGKTLDLCLFGADCTEKNIKKLKLLVSVDCCFVFSTEEFGRHGIIAGYPRCYRCLKPIKPFELKRFLEYLFM